MCWGKSSRLYPQQFPSVPRLATGQLDGLADLAAHICGFVFLSSAPLRFSKLSSEKCHFNHDLFSLGPLTGLRFHSPSRLKWRSMKRESFLSVELVTLQLFQTFFWGVGKHNVKLCETLPWYIICWIYSWASLPGLHSRTIQNNMVFLCSPTFCAYIKNWVSLRVLLLCQPRMLQMCHKACLWHVGSRLCQWGALHYLTHCAPLFRVVPRAGVTWAPL